MDSPSVLRGILIVLMIIFNISCAAATCPSGWFGNKCQFQCHCSVSAECDEYHSSCPSGCDGNWFGPACQYESMSFTWRGESDPNWLTDKNDKTCNDGRTPNVFVTLDTPIPLTWIRLVFSNTVNTDNVDQMSLYYYSGRDSGHLCPKDTIAKVDDTTVDISCSTLDVVDRLYVSGNDLKGLCSMYISGGRNVALKQEAAQSSTWLSGRGWRASNAVDGQTGVSLSASNKKFTCTHTQLDSNPGSWWRLTFSQAMYISRFEIYNRDEDCCRARLQNFLLTARSDSGDDTYTYEDKSESPKAKYIVVPSPKLSYPVKRVRVDEGAPDNVILTLCEVFIFGEIHCPPGKFGLSCERSCNCYKEGESCFVHSGGCPSGCAPGYTGEDCSVCDAGTYGADCDQTCNATCGGEENMCRASTGECTNGCDPGYTGRFCQTKCAAGSWGPMCSQTCSAQCKGGDEECNHVDGTCTNGCKDGYQGDLCESVCPVGTYGPRCVKPCSVQCRGQTNACDHRNGACIDGCEKGYQGTMCDSMCETGAYGYGCLKTCNANCKGPDNDCDRFEGACSNGCEDGFGGDYCDACETGKYGERCEKSCSVHCAGAGDPCKRYKGYCNEGCDPGYYWRKCTQACPSGKFGDRCSGRCSENCAGKNNACDHINGTCESGCDPGYRSARCDQKCDTGYYGDGCSEKCSEHCGGYPKSCDHVTGACDMGCDPGYHGDPCTEECPPGFYGNECLKRCSDHCAVGDNACHHVSGFCDICEPGYTGRRCEKKCDLGYYGVGCNKTCSEHCRTKACHHANGFCDEGCDPGYYGVLCTQECPVGKYGQECQESCSSHCAGSEKSCHHVTGYCDTCVPGYMGRSCEKTCHFGSYGYGCKGICSEHCAGFKNPCNHINGTCDSGCDEGYKGLLCEEECDAKTYGQNCAQECSDRCLNSDCHHESGLCRACEPGYSGDLCIELCKPETWGAGCRQQCSINCVYRLCHPETGKCHGCPKTKTGDYCETTKQPQTEDKGNPALAALPGVLGVLLIIAVIFFGIVFWRNFKKNQVRKQEEESAISLDGRSVAASHANVGSEVNASRSSKKRATTRRKDGFEDESEEDNDKDTAGPVNPLTGNTAVPVETLKAYILQHSADSHIKDEFTSIPMANNAAQKCGLLPQNIKKNRYKNIIPYDASRVRLQKIEGNKYSDYINASHVQGYTSDKTFIASQGPNDVILNDFVRMLWEQRVKRVVMLTNLIEMGKKKCSMYWPADGEEEFGEVTVRLLTTHVFAEYTIRNLRLTKSGESARDLTQFHFTAWPDKLVPDSPWGLVDLHQRVMAAPGSGPLLVHCSAGVGRTGTFIALCNLLQEAEATGKMDFLAALWKLRQDRMHTIQTVAQYTFLHKVALVAHVTAGTTIQVKDMYTRMASLESNMGSDRSARSFEQEFEAIVEVCDATTNKPKEQPEEQKQKECVYQNTGGAINKSKDRLSNILPNQIYRPVLTAEAHHEDTYINAVLVPSLNKDSQDVLTQVPLPSTVTDFWRLVMQYNVGLVVAFDTDSRLSDETIGEFLPNSETEPFENERFKVETKPPVDCRLVKELALTVHQKLVPGMDSSNTQKKRTLTLLQCKTTELDPQSVIELHEKIRFRRPSSKSRVVYLCRNGADHCGRTCVQSILLDRMEVDQCLTVPLVVGAIKAIRPQVIPTVDQYKSLYQVLKLSQESQNVYGNVGDMPAAL